LIVRSRAKAEVWVNGPYHIANLGTPSKIVEIFPDYQDYA